MQSARRRGRAAATSIRFDSRRDNKGDSTDEQDDVGRSLTGIAAKTRSINSRRTGRPWRSQAGIPEVNAVERRRTCPGRRKSWAEFRLLYRRSYERAGRGRERCPYPRNRRSLSIAVLNFAFTVDSR
jgi:hypothetical protein